MIANDLAAVDARIAAIDPSPVPPLALDASDSRASAFDAFVARARNAPASDRAAMVRAVRDGARDAGIDPKLALAVARTESNFDASATSRTGAAGLMQLMPETAREVGVHDRYDALENARGGARYLQQLLDRFGGDVTRAVAAYNAGPGAVERYRGIPPFAETQAYVARVLAAYRSPDDAAM